MQKVKGMPVFHMIGQRLFTGRVAVAQAALEFRRGLFDMTKKYTDTKPCWSPSGDFPRPAPRLLAIALALRRGAGGCEAGCGVAPALMGRSVSYGVAPVPAVQKRPMLALTHGRHTCK